ncbi:hypothetical protein [Candidatus Bodocaedibacter vickermanii]|uniref:Uncharacterized protein n=1 Tax=Candidatus Bodocaedibacter vickermanii TaxID=2741701 RepID=A0A7L9RV23_9PROT|nr:hypothetical protein CPBP_01151 [Candidatus Paracaedibacteraceae bacterium 'Lake Konstanz']
MRVKLLLSCALLTNLVGVYGSGTEVPRHNEEAAGSRLGEY